MVGWVTNVLEKDISGDGLDLAVEKKWINNTEASSLQLTGASRVLCPLCAFHFWPTVLDVKIHIRETIHETQYFLHD